MTAPTRPAGLPAPSVDAITPEAQAKVARALATGLNQGGVPAPVARQLAEAMVKMQMSEARESGKLPGEVAVTDADVRRLLDETFPGWENVAGSPTPPTTTGKALTKAAALHKAGDPDALRDWYNAGADGAIDWGSPGDFDACVAIAGKYIDDPEGFCNLRHQDATGGPPAHAPGEESDKGA